MYKIELYIKLSYVTDECKVQIFLLCSSSLTLTISSILVLLSIFSIKITFHIFKLCIVWSMFVVKKKVFVVVIFLARNMENMEALSEGTVYKKEDRRVKLSDNTDDVTEEKLNQSLMASLLEYQNSEAERLIRALAGKVCQHCS